MAATRKKFRRVQMGHISRKPTRISQDSPRRHALLNRPIPAPLKRSKSTDARRVQLTLRSGAVVGSLKLCMESKATHASSEEAGNGAFVSEHEGALNIWNSCWK